MPKLVRRTENSAIFALGCTAITREVKTALAGCIKRDISNVKFQFRCGRTNHRNQYALITY